MPHTEDVWSPVSLPYVKDDQIDLPSPAVIKDSPNIISQRSGQTVVAVKPSIIVKYGRSTLQREGQALHYLEQHAPQVPAPSLLAMYYDGEELFIVMERIPGVTLDRIWPNLSHEEKTMVGTQLYTIFECLRATTCPVGTRYGSVDGGPVPYFLFYSDRKDDYQITGPFPTEHDFNAGLVAKYKYIQEINGCTDFKSRFYEKHIDKVLTGHKATLTHSDVQGKNIMLTETSDNAQNERRSFKVTLVDWEDAGWYPDYWEYFVAFTAFRWEEDWCERVEEFIKPWPAEISFMKMIYTDLFF